MCLRFQPAPTSSAACAAPARHVRARTHAHTYTRALAPAIIHCTHAHTRKYSQALVHAGTHTHAGAHTSASTHTRTGTLGFLRHPLFAVLLFELVLEWTDDLAAAFLVIHETLPHLRRHWASAPPHLRRDKPTYRKQANKPASPRAETGFTFVGHTAIGSALLALPTRGVPLLPSSARWHTAACLLCVRCAVALLRCLRTRRCLCRDSEHARGVALPPLGCCFAVRRIRFDVCLVGRLFCLFVCLSVCLFVCLFVWFQAAGAYAFSPLLWQYNTQASLAARPKDNGQTTGRAADEAGWRRGTTGADDRHAVKGPRGVNRPHCARARPRLRGGLSPARWRWAGRRTV
jgi:hypothetical protein